MSGTTQEHPVAEVGTRFLSKSAYLAGQQCKKLLWHRFNARDQFPPIDEATQAIFDQGHEVGALAKKLFPDGIELGTGVYDLF